MILRRTIVLLFVLPSVLLALNTASLIQEFSSQRFEGRRSGSLGGALAADFLDSLLHASPLEPLSPAPSFRQAFSFLNGFEEQTAALSFRQGNAEWVEVENGLCALAASASTSAQNSLHQKLPLVFAGFGLDIPGQWQDLDEIDLQGACALVMRGAPSKLHALAHSPALDLLSRVKNLKARGAAAVLFIDNPFDPPQSPPSHVSPDPVFSDAGLPLLAVSAELADRLMPVSKTVKVMCAQMNRRRKSLAQTFPDSFVRLQISNRRIEAETWNLVAQLPAADPSAKTIIIGAHYDHLGYGEKGESALHPGADDNASGSMQLLELAHRLALVPLQERSYRLVFIWFGAEELGLIGSRFWLESGPVEKEKIAFMLNLDMLGRLRDRELYLLGGNDNPRLDALLKRLAGERDLHILASPALPGGGDHASFLEAAIPAALLFTGPHEDYHRPEDRFESIVTTGLAPVADLLEACFKELLTGFIFDPPPSGQLRRSKDQHETLRVAFGIIPGYDAVEGGGLLVKSVRSASPAERAGLLAGDAILSVGQWPVNNIFDYTFALRHLSAGDSVRLLIQRGDQHLTLQATLGERIR
jgi:aminopeptidase YwaD